MKFDYSPQRLSQQDKAVEDFRKAGEQEADHANLVARQPLGCD